jgi:mRNA-degrading endonuclease YafQ of YafQ-DinJ toxin-antitoxin module
VATLQGHTDRVTACTVTPDGRHIVSASYDHTLKIWDLASGSAVATLRDHTDCVRACAVTPDGRLVVSASYDHTLKIWDLANGRVVTTLQGHTSGVRACAVTLDGRLVLSASEDHTLKVWELATHTCRITHRGDAGYAAVAVGSTTVVAGDAAGAVWILDVPPDLASPVDARSVPEPRITHTIAPIAAPAPAATPSPNVAAGTAGHVHATRDRHAESSPTQENNMSPEELLSQLLKLLSSQFEEVLYRAQIPVEHLPGPTASQTERAVEVMRYVEQQNRLEQLARIVQQVVTGGGPASLGPR